MDTTAAAATAPAKTPPATPVPAAITLMPGVGRVVWFQSHDHIYSGAEPGREVPAIITRVWSDTCVNLMVMRDGSGNTPICVTSVGMCDDPDQFSATHNSWRWMPFQKAFAAERTAAGLTPT